jgi:ribosome recycling factor
MEVSFNKKEVEDFIKKVLENLESSLRSVNINNITPALIENNMVSCDGGSKPLKNIAKIHLDKDGRSLLVIPINPDHFADISNSFSKSSFSVSPSGSTVRISFPAFTKEMETKIIESIRKTADLAKSAIRTDRDKTLKKIKTEKSENTRDRFEKEAEKLYSDANKKIDDTINNTKKRLGITK